jgi:hypothetical protein
MIDGNVVELDTDPHGSGEFLSDPDSVLKVADPDPGKI